MSKIPQGEWSAIAARHARGETIARIAHDYGCTAPAIHYILKRQKARAGSAVAGVARGVNTAAPAAAASAEAATTSRPTSQLRLASEVRPAAELHSASEIRPTESRSALEIRTASDAAEPRPARVEEPQRSNAPVFAVGPAGGEPRQSEHRPEPRPFTARGSALKAGLDTELKSQMEEAIEAFRSNLNAALVDRSPARREELRAAASDLMRMAARTMIVLDRLSAVHDRAPGHASDYPRSTHVR
jgi:transposase-like protein